MRRAAWLLLLLTLGPILAVADGPPALAALDRMIAGGAHARALAQATTRLEALPASERLTAWEIAFGGEVLRVATGRRCLVYQLHLPNARKDAPGRRGALDTVSANHAHSGWAFAIVCVDLRSGQIRWSRRVNGLMLLAVDARSDHVYLWREKVLRLDPTTGAVLWQRELPGKGRAVGGLLLGARVAVRRTHGDHRTSICHGPCTVYDPRRDEVKTVELGDYTLMAPDERRRLKPARGAWACVDLQTEQALWRWNGAPTGRPPLWHAGGLFVFCGEQWSNGRVVSLDPATGTPRWTARLGWGAYSIGHHQLSSNGYPDEDWVPLVGCGDDVLTLDGAGRIVLLDRATGRETLALPLCRDHLRAPLRVDETLVVCSFEWLRAYPLRSIGRTSLEAALRQRQARCLLALGRPAEALATLDHLLDRAPRDAAAWALRAEALEASPPSPEAGFSHLQAAAMSGRGAGQRLTERWGLTRLVDLNGMPTWQLQSVGRTVYAGTQRGQLWSVRTDSLEASLVTQLPYEIDRLEQRPRLIAAPGNYSRKRLPIELPPARKPDADPRIPRDWWTQGGVRRIGPATTYRGRSFRTLLGGAVRVLEGTTMRDLPATLPGIGTWEIKLTPQGPLGHGQGGVFALDRDLRPSRVIHPGNVRFLARTAETLGMVVYSRKLGTRLEICRLDGSGLVRASLGRFTSGWATAAQLIPLGDGYLFSDRQLTWLGTNGKVWRFGPRLDRYNPRRNPHRGRYFGVPMMAGGQVYVTTRDGLLLVFDPLRIRAGAR